MEKSRIHFTSICMALWFPISVNGLPPFVQIMMVADVAGANPPSKLAASPSLAEYFYSLA